MERFTGIKPTLGCSGKAELIAIVEQSSIVRGL